MLRNILLCDMVHEAHYYYALANIEIFFIYDLGKKNYLLFILLRKNINMHDMNDFTHDNITDMYDILLSCFMRFGVHLDIYTFDPC